MNHRTVAALVGFLILTPFVALSASCPALSLGSTGPGVIALQKFLITQYSDFPVSTGTFEVDTESAVKQWQKEHNIVSFGSATSTGWGVVGPKTGTAMGLCKPTISANTTPTNSSFTQTLINALLAQVALLQQQLAALLAQGAQTTQTGTIGSFCAWSGGTVPNDSVVVAYQTFQVPAGSTCAQEIRTCSNGNLSGSYQYAGCSVFGEQTQASCPVYQRPLCTSNEDIIAGSLQSDGCNGPPRCVTKPNTTASCTFNGTSVRHGTAVNAYQASTVLYGSTCTSQTRLCTNGVFSGDNSFNKDSCSVAAPTCTLDGLTLQSGSSSPFYFAQNVQASELCSSYAQTRSCSNGTLSGSTAYMYRFCAPVSSNSCALDNVVVTNASSSAFYRHRVPPAGELCTAHNLTRTCNNGVLGGNASFVYATCSNTTPCTLGGITLAHSSSSLFYKENSVAFGTTCASVSANRTCTNGKLSASDDYKYSACSVSPSASSGQTRQLATVLIALEAVLKAILARLGQ